MGVFPVYSLSNQESLTADLGQSKLEKIGYLWFLQNEGIRFVKREKNNRVEFSHGRTIEMLDSHHAAW